MLRSLIRSYGFLAAALCVTTLGDAEQATSTPTSTPEPGNVPGFCAVYPQLPGPDDWQSSIVYYSPEGTLTYEVDAAGNQIPDYSYAGYKYGQVDLPSVPEVLRLTPGSGDQTARIQAAIDQVGALTPDESGIRGALVLDPGVYEIWGTLHVQHSGVVLRGSGDGGDPTTNTVLRAPGEAPHQRNVIRFGSGVNTWTESSRTNVTSLFVQVGSKSIDVVGRYIRHVAPGAQPRRVHTSATLLAPRRAKAIAVARPTPADAPVMAKTSDRLCESMRCSIPALLRGAHAVSRQVQQRKTEIVELTPASRKKGDSSQVHQRLRR